jgi:hypothetical protein
MKHLPFPGVSFGGRIMDHDNQKTVPATGQSGLIVAIIALLLAIGSWVFVIVRDKNSRALHEKTTAELALTRMDFEDKNKRVVEQIKALESADSALRREL